MLVIGAFATLSATLGNISSTFVAVGNPRGTGEAVLYDLTTKAEVGPCRSL